MTPSERAPLEALARAHGAQLVEHDPDGELVEVGPPVELEGLSIPARAHRSVAEADRVIAVGIVELHQYAGYSGGSKAISIGCAARSTIGAFHGTRLLSHPGVKIGRVEGNPFRAALDAIAKGLGTVDALCLVPGADTVVYGEVESAFARAVELAKPHVFVELDAPVEVLVLRVPREKGSSFYQASRAATYAAEVDAPAVIPGGLLVVEAACEEGLGLGSGELAFAAAIDRGRAEILDELRRGIESGGGAQRAMVLARALERFQIALVGPRIRALERFGIRCVASLEELRIGARSTSFANPFEKLPRIAG